jgi:hypothetical protein
MQFVIFLECWICSQHLLTSPREFCRFLKATETSDCSETTLTGESRFHISTPLGIEPGSLMTGSKRVTHWTSETVYECSEIAGSPQGSPQQPTMSIVKPEGGSAARMKLGQKSCLRSSGIITLSHYGLVTVLIRSPPQTRPQWSIMSESPM